MHAPTRPYESPLRQEQSEATRDRIVEALCQLLVEERPSNLSMPAVAKRAGVSVRTVYHHFATKDDLFDAVDAHVRRKLRGSEVSDEEVLAENDDVVALVQRELPGLARSAPLFSALERAGLEPGDQMRARHQAHLEVFAASLGRQADLVDPDDCRRLAILLTGIASWRTTQRMQRAGLDVDETVDLVSWVVEIVMDAVRSSGTVGPPAPRRGGNAARREDR